MVDKELTMTESYDLHVAKKDPESRRSIKTFLEIISNLTDRLAETNKQLEDQEYKEGQGLRVYND